MEEREVDDWLLSESKSASSFAILLLGRVVFIQRVFGCSVQCENGLGDYSTDNNDDDEK